MSKSFVKYGEKTMELPAGMTLAQAKQQMARFFPELADPEVKTDKQGDDTVYTFSKKAGRKGAAPLATLTGRLRKVRATPIAPPKVIAVALGQTDGRDVNLDKALDALLAEGRAVEQWRKAATALPPAWPARRSRGLLL